MKQCARCKLEKHREEFYSRHRCWRFPDGLEKVCNHCYDLRLEEKAATNLLRSRFYVAVTKDKVKYNPFMIEFVGCTREEFRLHMEKLFKPGMTWDNRSLWHIDHIIPCAAFRMAEIEEQKKCFHYSNLRPEWAHDNLSKGRHSKLKGEEGQERVEYNYYKKLAS